MIQKNIKLALTMNDILNKVQNLSLILLLDLSEIVQQATYSKVWSKVAKLFSNIRICG